MVTITPEYFLQATGEDLTSVLPNLDSDSNKEDIFIKDVTEFIYEHVGTYGQYQIPEDDRLSDFQIRMIRKSIVMQGKYILDNGLLNNISGYDEERGVTVSRAYLNTIAIAPSAEKSLYRCGLLNRNVRDLHSGGRIPFTRGRF